MRKTVLLLILALISLSVFAGCVTTGTEDISDTSSETSELDLELKNLNGRVINVLSWDFTHGSKSILGFTGEILSNKPEEEYSVVDVAKAEARNRVEEDYNCTISGLVYGENKDEFYDMVRNSVLTGTGEHDMVFIGYATLAQMVVDDLLLDLNTINTIDFTNDWWDQNAREELSLFNRLYFMCGDINTYDNDGTWSMLFNKTLLKDLGLGIDFYQLVRDDEWYFDKFVEICKSDITKNSNGDSVLDEEDTWAFGTETYNIYVHVVSGGNKIVTKNKDDIPEFSIQNESTYNALAKIMDFYLDTSTVMVGNAPPYTNKGFPNVWEATVHRAFIEGRELFYMCGLINVPSFREMADDFGILPIPKLNESQDNYYHTVSINNMTALSVPKGVKDPDDLGLVIEALGMYSQKYLTPAYYDVQLKYRDTRDDESQEMLDIIFSTRTFDIGAAFNWGGTMGQYMVMDKNFVSRFESVMTSAENAMQQTLDKISD